MSETRKIAAILVADVVGYSRLAGADEERTLARLRALRSDLIDPTIALHHGRIVKRTGDGSLIEFRSVVDAVRCAIEIQTGMFERNAGLPPERRIEFRMGVHLGDVVEEDDGDLMGDGVNIAARLEGVAKPGAICLSEDAYRQVKSRLNLKVADLGATQLKNIAEPIRVFAIETMRMVPEKDASETEPTVNESTSPWLSPPDKPSIAVLPFQNMSGDHEQEYFADGVVEEITTALSRIKWLFVIARNSSFTYKGRAVDVRQVGRDLGVRYVLEGGVRKSGTRLRITAQLIEADTGAHLWADKFDGAIADVFDLQDQIAQSVTATMEPRLFAAEHTRFQSRRPENLDAWGFVMKAMPHVWSWRSTQEIETAIGLLARALEIEPDYPRANSLLAWARATGVHQGWAEARGALTGARSMAQRAVQADPDDPWSHFAAGYVHMISRDFRQAVTELNEAIALNPSFAFAHLILGVTYGFGGIPEDGLKHIAIATRLSPRDFTKSANFSSSGLCHFIAGRFDEAADCERRAVELQPDFVSAWRTYAAAAGMAGRQDEATRALSQAKQLQPSLSIEWVEKYYQIVDARDRGVYIKGLRAAGLE
jgi:adenylate cyclase